MIHLTTVRDNVEAIVVFEFDTCQKETGSEAVKRDKDCWANCNCNCDCRSERWHEAFQRNVSLSLTLTYARGKRESKGVLVVVTPDSEF
jgi:hypothetical protein